MNDFFFYSSALMAQHLHTPSRDSFSGAYSNCGYVQQVISPFHSILDSIPLSHSNIGWNSGNMYILTPELASYWSIEYSKHVTLNHAKGGG